MGYTLGQAAKAVGMSNSEERGVTGGETALAEASTRATPAEARLSDFKSMLDDIREQRDRWQQQAERLAAHPRSLSRGPQPSDGRMTQNRTPLLGPTCLGAQTWAPPSGATTLLILSLGTGTHSPSTLTS